MKSDIRYGGEDSISFEILKSKVIILVRFCLLHWVVLVWCMVTFMGLGMVLSLIIDTKYSAEWDFTIEGNKPTNNISSLASSLGLAVGANTYTTFSGDNVIELLSSKRLIEGALLSTVINPIDSNQITIVEYFTKNANSKWPRFFQDQDSVIFAVDQTRYLHSRYQDSLLNEVSEKLLKRNIKTAKRDPKLPIIELKVVSTDEFFAMEFSKALLRKISDFYIETKTQAVKNNIASFYTEAHKVRYSLDTLLCERAKYLDQNVYMTKEVGQVKLKQMEIDIQVMTTTYIEVMKNIETLKLELAQDAPLFQVFDHPIYPLKRLEMSVFKGAFSGLLLGVIAGVGYCSVLLRGGKVV